MECEECVRRSGLTCLHLLSGHFRVARLRLKQIQGSLRRNSNRKHLKKKKRKRKEKACHTLKDDVDKQEQEDVAAAALSGCFLISFLGSPVLSAPLASERLGGRGGGSGVEGGDQGETNSL